MGNGKLPVPHQGACGNLDSDQPGEPEQRGCSKNPQGIQPRCIRHQGGPGDHGHCPKIVRGHRCHDERARRNEPDRDRQQAGLDRAPPRRFFEALPDPPDIEGEHAGGAAHRECRDQRPRQSGDVIADEGHHDDVRSRCHLCEREYVGELAVAHPVLHLDREAVHFRDGRVGAAHREQRHEREMAGQRRERAPVVFHGRVCACRDQATAMLRGTSSASAQCSGQRSTPTVAKVASAISGAIARRSLKRGRAILAQVPITNPAAAAATPTSMRCNAASSPKYA